MALTQLGHMCVDMTRHLLTDGWIRTIAFMRMHASNVACNTMTDKTWLPIRKATGPHAWHNEDGSLQIECSAVCLRSCTCGTEESITMHAAAACTIHRPVAERPLGIQHERRLINGRGGPGIRPSASHAAWTPRAGRRSALRRRRDGPARKKYEYDALFDYQLTNKGNETSR